jgi:hypothetical protein
MIDHSTIMSAKNSDQSKKALSGRES